MCRKIERREQENRGEKEEEERKKGEKIFCERKSFITKRKNSDFGLEKSTRRLILVSSL